MGVIPPAFGADRYLGALDVAASTGRFGGLRSHMSVWKCAPVCGLPNATLSDKKNADFFGKQITSERLAIAALLVALSIGEFGKHHFGNDEIALFVHSFFGIGKPYLDLAALNLNLVSS